MAINFPHSPSVNDTHTHSGKEWTWNGTSWILSTNASNYTLPIATAGALGGIKVGSRLTIDSGTGVLSADVQGGGTSTTINNNADNRLITGSGTANTLEAESDLTFDPSSNRLSIGENGTDAYLEVGTGAPGTAGTNRFQIRSNNSSNYLYSYADSMFHISVAKASGGGTIQLDSISSTMAQFVRGAECSLYHSGTKRIETTSDGIKISGGIQDKDGQLGTSGQILSSTGTELDWIDAPSGGGGGGSGSGGSILQLIQETGPSGQISATAGQGSNAAWIDVIDKDITITAGADKRVKIEVNGEPKLNGFRTMRYEIRLIRTTSSVETTLYEGYQGLADSSDNYSTMNGVLYLDTPGAGTHNYKYQFRQVISWNNSAAYVEADSMVMLLTEIDLSAGSSGGASVTSSDTAPTNPTAGDIWFKTDELALKIYYNDGDSNQWVDAIAPAMASGGGGGVPTGTIAMWSGAANAIPTGWTVCDGTNGTPDLRDRFVVGAGTLYSVDATGGSADAVVVEHSHTTNIDGGHVIPGNGGSSFPYGGAGTYSSTVFSMNDEGVSGTNANLPPYYALCYIICTSTAGSGGGGGASVTVNDNAPTSPSSGDLWWNSDAGQLKIYYNDGSSSQWVDAAGGGGGGAGGVSIYNSMANYPTASNHEGQLAYASDINAMHYSNGTGWVGQRIVTTDDTNSSDFDTLLGNFEKTYTLSAVEHTGGTVSENSARKVIKLVDNSSNDAGKFTINVASGLTSTLTTDAWSNESINLGLSLGSIHNYTLSAEINAGPNATDLRLGDSVRSISNNIKFAGADGLSIERTDANTITFRQGGGSVTQYTDAMAKDAAWAAISGGTHQNITFTYDSTNKFISANSSGSGGGGGGVTYDLQGRNTTSSNAFIDLVPSNGATDSIEFTGSGGTDVAWDSANNKITINTHNYAVGANAAASGSGSIALVSGTFTYTPPDLSNFLTSVPIATASAVGGVKQGANCTIQADGTLDVTQGSYTLPTAGVTASGDLGGVKVDGSTITIDGNGVISSSGGSTTPSIGDVNATSASIDNDARGDLTIVGHKGYVLYKVHSSHQAWVRLYVDAASRTADVSRGEGEDPLPGSGVIAEVRTSADNQAVLITPGVMGFNNDDPRTENIYVSINNRSGSSATITVTLTVLKIGE